MTFARSAWLWRLGILLAAALCLPPPAAAQSGDPNSPPATQTIVETRIKGVITNVRIAPGGGGPPSVEIRDDDSNQWTILLGAIHFLIREDFHPKAGQKIEVVAIYRTGFRAFARKVTLPGDGNKTLVFRDAQGLPVWRPVWRRNPGTP